MPRGNENLEVCITGISVAGNERTSLSFFEKELMDIKPGSSLKTVSMGLSQITQRMLEMNMFDCVDTRLNIESFKDGKYQAQVRFEVQEKGIPFLKMSSYLKAGGTSEVGFELQGALRSPLGRGEMVKLSSITGQSGNHEFLGSVTIPHILAPWRGDLNVTARMGQESQSFYTSFQSKLNSLTMELASRDKMHLLVAEYSHRDEVPTFLAVPFSPLPTLSSSANTGAYTGAVMHGKSSGVKPLPFPASGTPPRAGAGVLTNEQSVALHHCGRHSLPAVQNLNGPFPMAGASVVTLHTATPSVKTALKYQCTMVDTMDCTSNPSEGSFLQASIEAALPPGSARFIRSEVTAQHHRELGPGIMGQPGLTLSLSGMLGVMRPLLVPDGTKSFANYLQSRRHGWSYLSDRYHLGGPNSLRGFEITGIGPRAYRTSCEQQQQQSRGSSSSNSYSISNSHSDRCSSGDHGSATITSTGGAVPTIKGKGTYFPNTASATTTTSTAAASEGTAWEIARAAAVAADSDRLSDSLGGDAKSTIFAALSVPVPIPLLARSSMRAFVFFNGGTIGNLYHYNSSGDAATAVGHYGSTNYSGSMGSGGSDGEMYRSGGGAGGNGDGSIAVASTTLVRSSPVRGSPSRTSSSSTGAGMVRTSAEQHRQRQQQQQDIEPKQRSSLRGSVLQEQVNPMFAGSAPAQARKPTSTRSAPLQNPAFQASANALPDYAQQQPLSFPQQYQQPHQQQQQQQQQILPVFGHLRASVGAGLNVSFQDSVRLEMTYSIPIVKARQDRVKQFQLGIGLIIS